MVTADLVIETSQAPSESRIGVAFQESALFSSLTVEESAALPVQELTGLDESIVALIVWMKLKAVGLADAGSLYPRELSGGMKKRAAIATESKVGVFVVTALVLPTVTINEVHTTQIVRGQVPFKTYLRDAGGLDADTSVLFGGIRVGRITTVHPTATIPRGSRSHSR